MTQHSLLARLYEAGILPCSFHKERVPADKSFVGNCHHTMPGGALPVVLVTYNDNRSEREVALEQARVRSHAARITHARRRNQRWQQRPPGCRCQESWLCSTCSPRATQFTRQSSLATSDPFASYAGHDLPSDCRRALEFSKFRLESGSD